MCQAKMSSLKKGHCMNKLNLRELMRSAYDTLTDCNLEIIKQKEKGIEFSLVDAYIIEQLEKRVSAISEMMKIKEVNT